MNRTIRYANTFQKAVAVAAAFLIGGLMLGFAAERGWERRRLQQAPAKTSLRLGGFDLINPLLECEIADETIGDQLLPPFKQDLKRLVQELIKRGVVREVSVYFRDLNNGPWHGINEDQKFYPASLLKIPMAMSVMKKAEADPLFLKRRVISTLTEDLSEGQIFTPFRKAEPKKTYIIEELLEIMLTESDNNAAELLRRNTPMDIVAETFSDLGVQPPAEGTVDYLTVKSFATFFRILFNASYLDKDSSERILSYLSRSSFRSGIVAGVPPAVPVANKYGEQNLGEWRELKELHDCGIVYYPDSPYLLCVMSKGDSYDGDAFAIQKISRFVFDVVDAHQRSQQDANQVMDGKFSDRPVLR